MGVAQEEEEQEKRMRYGQEAEKRGKRIKESMTRKRGKGEKHGSRRVRGGEKKKSKQETG